MRRLRISESREVTDAMIVVVVLLLCTLQSQEQGAADVDHAIRYAFVNSTTKKGRVHVGWAIIMLDMRISNVWRARIMTTCPPAGKSLDET